MRAQLDVQKRQHKERGQLASRQRLGLLEKHKDYVKRAKDYHSKEDRIKKLQEKAAARNKDEFYFGMINSKTQKGVHVQDRGNEAMPVDVVKLLKTQDAGYVRTLISTEEKLIDRLKSDLGSLVGLQEDDDTGMQDEDISEDEDNLGEGPSSSRQAVLNLLSATGGQGKKTVFVDTMQQVAKYIPKKVSSKAKGKAKAGTSVEDEEAAAEAALAVAKSRRANIGQKSAELGARLERLALLQRTFREMQVQRSVMGKGGKMVVGDRKGGMSREDERLNEADMDELELKRMGSKKKKLPTPEIGIRTGARVWKWKAERSR